MRLTLGLSKLMASLGEHRAGELGEEAGDAGFDIFVRLDVFAGASVLGGQAVEEPGVHVVADAEGEDAGVGLVGFLGTFGDGDFAGFAGGGQAVGQEEDVGGA